MRIEEDIKLDYADVLFRPKRSTLSSRKDVELKRTYKFKYSNHQWTGIPVIAANMDGVGEIEIAKHFKALPDLHDDFAEWYHDYMSQNTWKPFDYTTIYLDDSYIKDWWESEGECFDDYDSPYDMIDPTPQYLYDDTGGEPPISAEERNRNSLDSKRDSHGHRYYSTNW